MPTKRASESVINTQSCTVQWQMKRFGWLFQDCTICMERLVMSSGYEGILQHKGIKPELVGKLGKCGHMYHLLCLVAMYNNGNKVGKSLCARSCYDVTLGSNDEPAMTRLQYCFYTDFISSYPNSSASVDCTALYKIIYILLSSVTCVKYKCSASQCRRGKEKQIQ